MGQLNYQPPPSYYDYVDWLKDVAEAHEQGQEWTSCEWYGHDYIDRDGHIGKICLDCGELTDE